SRRRVDSRVVSNGRHVRGGQAHESKRKQSSLFSRDSVSRAEPGTSSAGFHFRPLQSAPPVVRNSVLERRAVAVLGDVSLGSRVSGDAGRQNGSAFLANAPKRTDHLFNEVSSRQNDSRSGGSIPCRYRGFRESERRGRGEAIVQRRILSALSDRIHDWRPGA